MKKFSNFIWSVLALILIHSCGVVSLDEQTRSQSISINSGQYPSTEGDLMIALTNNETKDWESTGFTMMFIDNFQSCRLDDMLTLNDNGTYKYDGGEVLCGAEDNKRVKTGIWELKYEDRKLVFDKGTSYEIDFYIEEASDNKVIVSSTYMQLKVVGRYEVGL